MNIESILCVLLNYITPSEQAILGIINKDCSIIVHNYTIPPYLASPCFFCSRITQKTFQGDATYCCNICLIKYKNDIFDLGFPSNTVIKNN